MAIRVVLIVTGLHQEKMMAKAKSKYADIIGDLPPFPPENPSYQAKIDEIKEKLRLSLMTPDQMAHEYEIVRTAKDDLNDTLATIQMRLTAVEQMLTKAYEDDDPGFGLFGAGPNAVRMKSGSTVAIQMEPTGRVIDKERFRLWCIESGLENSLQLWPTTMISITKERLLEGQSAPDGVEAFARPKIVWRKG